MKYFFFSFVFCLSFLSLFVFVQEEEFGLVLYYFDGFQGCFIVYGDIYDKDELICVYKCYFYGIMFWVICLDNKCFVNVKVIDKGLFIKGWVVDLLCCVVEVLGIIDMGLVEVKVECLGSSSVLVLVEVVCMVFEFVFILEVMDEFVLM